MTMTHPTLPLVQAPAASLIARTTPARPAWLRVTPPRSPLPLVDTPVTAPRGAASIGQRLVAISPTAAVSAAPPEQPLPTPRPAPADAPAPVRYGHTTEPVVVSLADLRRCVQQACGTTSGRILLSLYVGDPSEIGPRGGLQQPACCFALADDAWNRDQGLDPILPTLAFTTRRNQIYCITSITGSTDDPRVYRYDTVNRRIDAMRPLVTDRFACRERLQRGEQLANEWVKRCAHRKAHGNREDYALATDPAVFRDCRARFHLGSRNAVPNRARRPVIACLAPPGRFQPDCDEEAQIHRRYDAHPARIELVPKPCWYANLRSSLPAATWRTVSTRVREQAGWRCAACGATPDHDELEAHEHWRYDDHHHIQRLAGLVCLCDRCHEVRHAGRASLTGRTDQVRARLMDLNGWSDDHTSAYELEIWSLWEQRSQCTTWQVDLTWLVQTHGVGPADFREADPGRAT